MMRKLIVLVGLVMVAVLAFEALDVSDADARKRRASPPPNFNLVLCSTSTPNCNGTPSSDLIMGADVANEHLRGGAGNDIYIGSARDGERYTDESTSSDLYEGFLNGEFFLEVIIDKGGLDRLDLSTSVSAYASTNFEFTKGDFDGDGAKDDLLLAEIHVDDNDAIYVTDHFGKGRMEYLKFSDKTISGSNIPGLITL